MKLYCKSTPTEGEHAYFTKVGNREFRIILEIEKRLTGKQVSVPKYAEGELYFYEEKRRYIRNRYIESTYIYEEITFVATLPPILGGKEIELSKSFQSLGIIDGIPEGIEIIDPKELNCCEKMEVEIERELELLPPIISKVRRKDRIIFTTPTGLRKEIFHEGYVGEDCLADYEKSAEYAGSFNYTQTVYVAVPKN